MADDEHETQGPHVLFSLEQDAPSKQWLMRWTTKWLAQHELVSMFETQLAHDFNQEVLRQIRLRKDGC